MIEVRCNQCRKFLFEVTEDTVGTVVIDCPRCKHLKSTRARRTIKLPIASADTREMTVARSIRQR